MSIEKSITLIVVAFIATLLAWVIFSREDRAEGAPQEKTASQGRADLRDLQGRTRGGGRPVDFKKGREGEWKPRAGTAAGKRAETSTHFDVKPVAGTRRKRTREKPPASPGGRRTVTVRRGDSFYRIAERELGDGRRYLEVAAANPGVDPMRLKPGQKIALPAAVTRPAPPTGRTAPAGKRSYTVRRGDTLSAIARRFYGSATKWPRLLEANKDRLSSPRKLKPGMVVIVP